MMVGQGRYPSADCASAKRNQNLRFSAQQVSHFEVFLCAQCAIEESQKNSAVVKRFDFFLFSVQQTRAKHEIEMLINFKNCFMNIGQGNLTAAAGGSPIHGELWLG
ncbi:hypothetical protein GALL_554550 [mine drainage metagenome]|uniref:Uncharacterized protein n=1 Tax=mine drainage metagenome TaxID=410659 RepID=A0A1J5NW92_9ZZZZ